MKKEKGSTHKKLSANEINRFIYCPYQWYYGRYYGKYYGKYYGNYGNEKES